MCISPFDCMSYSINYILFCSFHSIHSIFFQVPPQYNEPLKMPIENDGKFFLPTDVFFIHLHGMDLNECLHSRAQYCLGVAPKTSIWFYLVLILFNRFSSSVAGNVFFAVPRSAIMGKSWHPGEATMWKLHQCTNRMCIPTNIGICQKYIAEECLFLSPSGHLKARLWQQIQIPLPFTNKFSAHPKNSECTAKQNSLGRLTSEFLQQSVLKLPATVYLLFFWLLKIGSISSPIWIYLILCFTIQV
jgi:hypothetical protein